MTLAADEQSIGETRMTEPAFQSAAQALTFAFNFTMQQYDRPLMNRLADGPGIRTGKGLGGLDGAAQAGFIRRRVSTLTHLQQSALVVKFAPSEIVCSCGNACCKGSRSNCEWDASLRALADYGEREALAGCSVNRNLTLMLLKKLIGRSSRVEGTDVSTLVRIASRAGVSENTADNHLSRLRVWFRGESSGRNGKAPKIGVEQAAMERIQVVLTEAGIITTEAVMA
jgi:DNA-binding transcriptional ArsR family regulator